MADQGSAPERKEAVCSVQKGRVCDMPNGDRSYTGYSPGEGLNARLEKDSESKMEQSYERDTARRQVLRGTLRRFLRSPASSSPPVLRDCISRWLNISQSEEVCLRCLSLVTDALFSNVSISIPENPRLGPELTTFSTFTVFSSLRSHQ